MTERPTTKCVLATSRIGADNALPAIDQHAIHMLPKCFLPSRYRPPDTECAMATLVQPWGYLTATTRLAMSRMHLRRTQKVM